MFKKVLEGSGSFMRVQEGSRIFRGGSMRFQQVKEGSKWSIMVHKVQKGPEGSRRLKKV